MSDYFDHLFIAELFTVNGIFYACAYNNNNNNNRFTALCPGLPG